MRRSICLLLCLFCLSATAQQYLLSGVCEGVYKGKAQLNIYGEDSCPKQFNIPIRHGEFSYTGNIPSPTLASISYHGGHPLYFCLEEGETRITFNADNPTLSRITGSRSTSQLRYLFENCGENPVCIKEYIVGHPNSIFSPFLVSQYLMDEPSESLLETYSLLCGEATKTYHYCLLASQLKQQQAVAVGQPMPDFIYCDSTKKEVHFDSTVLSRPEYEGEKIAILIGASWCSQCQRVASQLDSLAKQGLTTAVTINLDNSPQVLDSPLMDQLCIPMIPYIILLDEQHRIAARDIRIWELPKLLKNQ